MRSQAWPHGVAPGVLTCIIAAAVMLSAAIPGAQAASVPPRSLGGQTPALVVGGRATLIGPHDPTTPLTLDVGLTVRHAAALDALIAAASDPSSPQYGHYLTNAAYMAHFAPLAQDVQAVRDWATTAGLTVQAVSPDRLLVLVAGTTRHVERALGVRINDYRAAGYAFRSNDRDPAVPANLPIRAISGLDTLHRFHTALQPRALRTGGYDPTAFRAAYNVAPVGDGSGQTIGFTLWGTAVAQSDLTTFASTTGTPALVAGQAGADGIDWIPVSGGSTDTSEQMEAAMDVEYAHGVAPHSHLTYWLASTLSAVGLEQAISAAANDPSVHVVSNSWLGGTATSATDPFVSNTNASLQRAASMGTTFYFASGDEGAWSGSSTIAPSYPADSPYVVAVGGTTLQTGSGFAYGSETAWSCPSYTGCLASGGSGGGCSAVFARPSWQSGVSAASCAGRAEPDVAADADPTTGAYVYALGTAWQLGGTSLATPLWAGMAADTNRYLGATGQAPMGFAAPRLYNLATAPLTGSRDFHDVTSGSNGFAAGPGWDEATGWGSPNLANLAADWAGGSVPARTPTATPTAAVTAAPTPSGTTIPSATSITPGTTAPATAPAIVPTATAPAIVPTATALATAQLSIAPSSGLPGTSFIIRGSGFGSGTVTVSWNGRSVWTVQTGDGHFSVQGLLATDAVPGVRTVAALNSATGRQANTLFTVLAAPSATPTTATPVPTSTPTRIPLPATAAPSQPPAGAPSLALTPTAAYPGAAITITGHGFVAGEMATLYWNGTAVVTTAVSPSGTLSIAVTLSTSAPAGPRTVVVQGSRGDHASALFTVL